jgi:Protein of unknown function (DUF421)
MSPGTPAFGHQDPSQGSLKLRSADCHLQSALCPGGRWRVASDQGEPSPEVVGRLASGLWGRAVLRVSYAEGWHRDCARRAAAHDYDDACVGPVTIDWRPRLLVKDGLPLREELHASRISMDELLSRAREAGLGDLGRVEQAHLETDGKISFVLRTSRSAP